MSFPPNAFLVSFGLTDEAFIKIKSLYSGDNFILVFIAGFTPIPFKLFTINAFIIRSPILIATN